MSDLDEVKTILFDIRDNQKRALEQQEKQVALATEQLDRAKTQVEESLRLQREAIAKQRTVTRFALPGIALCMFAIVYLIVRYF